MRADEWVQGQKDFYDRRLHRRLRASEGGLYAENLVAKVWEALGAPAGARGIEVGCGAGRFTLPLLERCAALDALDLSRTQLERLRAELDRRGIPAGRCRLHEADAETLGAQLPEGGYDFATGVFLLHHLLDPLRALSRLRERLRPGGRAAFVEPNRWNPLFALQISLCADMTWRDEWRLYGLGARRLRRLFESAGFRDCRVERAGFFPPQVLNRFPSALRLERRLERVRPLQPLLPFLVVCGRRADAP